MECGDFITARNRPKFVGDILKFFFKLLFGVFCILGLISFLYYNSVQRKLSEHFYYCRLDGTSNLPLTNGDPDGGAFGVIKFDSISNTVLFDFTFYQLSIITSLEIRGPLSSSSPQIAPAFLPTDGNSVVDQSENKHGNGSIFVRLNLDHYSIQAVAENPQNYYVLFKTIDYPNGALRGYFTGQFISN